MKTNNRVANYIAFKGVTKHMTKDEARHIWSDLKREGWRAEGLTLVKMDGDTEHHFVFEQHPPKVWLSHRAITRTMEVAL